MLDDILDMVIAAGLALPKECFARQRPDAVSGKSPRCLTVRYYGSEQPQTTFSLTTQEWPHVQFEFRETPSRFPQLEEWARDVLAWATTFLAVTTHGVEYIAVEPLTGIVDTGNDGSGNPLVAFSARVGRISVVEGTRV